jgi:hypothetical protein
MPARSSSTSSTNSTSRHGRRPFFKANVINLNRDMTCAEICERLERSIFCNDFHLVRIDADVRNYLLAALRRKI